MSFIQQILSNPLVKKFLSPKVFVYLFLFTMALALFYLIYRKFAGKKGKKAKVKKLSTSALLKIWKEFLRQVPREFRRSILLYRPCVVLGEAESGKSHIIDKYTDWQGQAAQFYPSYTTNPDLQIYLGSQVIVQEIPQPLLHDTVKGTRHALTKLWKETLYKRKPIVVVVVNATEITTIDPKVMRKQAQMVRGKINIISAILKKSVQTRIVLTHMDQLSGYAEFVHFIQQQKLSLEITLQAGAVEDEDCVRNCLNTYEVYLPRALTELPATDYKAIVHFFHNAPHTFAALQNFLNDLTEADPLSCDVDLDNLYLTSNIDQESVSNPFATTKISDLLLRIRRILFKHRVACLLLAALGLGYMTFGYVHEQTKLRGEQKSMAKLQMTAATFAQAPTPKPYNIFEQTMHGQMEKVLEYDKEDPLADMLPHFSEHAQRPLRQRLTTALREYYLQPLLQEHSKSGSREKTFYLLSLLYASKQNDLGELLTARSAEWEQNLRLSKRIIEVYIKNNDANWDDYQLHKHKLSLNDRRNLMKRFIAGMRTHYLQPLLGEYKKSPQLMEKVYYLLAFWYATQDNGLGKLIRTRLEEWEQNLPISKQVISLYIRYNSSLRDDESLHRTMPGKRADCNLMKEFAQAMRVHYLQPLLENYNFSPAVQAKAFYLISLLYATHDSDLARLIAERIGEWERNLKIPRQIIHLYVDNSEVLWEDSKSHQLVAKLYSRVTRYDLRIWLPYFKKVRKALTQRFLRREFLQNLQEGAKEILSNLEAAQRYQLARIILVCLPQDVVHKAQIAIVDSPFVAEFNVFEREVYQAVYDLLLLVRRSRIDNSEEQRNIIPQVQNLSLHDLITELHTMKEVIDDLSQEKNRKNGVQLTVGKEIFTLSAEKWIRLIQRTKIRLLILRYVRHHQRHERRSIFFSRYSNYPDVAMNPYNDGSFLFTGKAVVNGFYTRTAYENEVQPVLEKIALLIPKLPLDKRERSHLRNFILHKLDRYTDDYRDYWREYYQSFGVKTNSVGGIKLIIKMMQFASSPFNDFLEDIAENTSIQSPQQSKGTFRYFSLLYEKLYRFRFVNRLIVVYREPKAKENTKVDKKDFPALASYHAILQQIGEELAKPGQEKKKKKKTPKAPLKSLQELLHPVGILSLPIFLSQTDSYLEETKNWLVSVGIVGEWQNPFLAPIFQLYQLGVRDIKTTALRHWREKVLPIVLPLFDEFPFYREAGSEMSPEQFEQILHPQLGSFSNAFQKIIAPICTERNGLWYPKPILFSERINMQGTILPQDSLKIGNHFSRLSRILWDEEGKPRKILLLVRPHPLPLTAVREEKAVLAYINSGQSSLFAFNQQPTWRQFYLQWWKPRISKVGLQLHNSDMEKKEYHEVIVEKSLWSFFKLLKQATSVRKNVWTWYIPDGDKNLLPTTFDIQIADPLRISPDPWSMFLLSGFSEK